MARFCKGIRSRPSHGETVWHVAEDRDRPRRDQQHVGAQGPEVVAGQQHEAGGVGRVPHRQRQRHDRAPGVAHHRRALDPESLECLVEQLGLLHRRPGPPARALAVPEAGAVEDDDAVGFQQLSGDAAGVVVVAGHGVAVDQDDRLPGAAVGVVQPDAVHLDELALGRMLALRPARRGVVGQGEGGSRRPAGERRPAPDEGLGRCDEGQCCVSRDGVAALG
jgi:hypothetical protein